MDAGAAACTRRAKCSGRTESCELMHTTWFHPRRVLYEIRVVRRVMICRINVIISRHVSRVFSGRERGCPVHVFTHEISVRGSRFRPFFFLRKGNAVHFFPFRVTFLIESAFSRAFTYIRWSRVLQKR